MRTLRVIAAIDVALLLAQPFAAQAQRPPKPSQRRWEISYTAGSSTGHASDAIKNAMQTNGFGDAAPCFLFCAGTVQHPFVSPGGITGDVSVSRGMGTPIHWRLKVEYASADLGEALGYHDPWMYLFVHTAVTSVAVSAELPFGEVLRIGAGPVYNHIVVERTDSHGEPTFSRTRLGAVVHAGLVVPAHSRFFAAVSAQRRFVGSESPGPFVARNDLDGTTHTLPRTAIDCSYSTVRFGIGVRF
ncbi:MAG TPA: hypothetical protein VJ992_01705 [Gemmatimonadales bacterium]|nr:hypothetical protein [Gemmatimonadales bacterium]